MQFGIFSGITATALWGLVFLAPRLLPDFSPLQLSLGRYLAYGALALLWALPSLYKWFYQSRRSVPPSLFWHLLRQIFAGNLIYYILLAYGVQWVGIAPTTLIIGLIPVVVAIAGRNDKHPTAHQPSMQQLFPAFVLIFVGLLSMQWTMFSGHGFAVGMVGGSTSTKFLGLACAVGALCSWSWYAIDNARTLQHHPEVSSQTWANAYGIGTGIVSVLCVVFYAAIFRVSLFTNNTVGHSSDWTWFWQLNIGIALLASLIGNTLWNVAARRLPLTLSGLLIVFETVFALLYSFIADQRWPNGLEVITIVSLLSGVIWAMSLHSSRRPIHTEQN